MEQNNLEEYLNHIYLQEDITSIAKKLTPDKLKSIGKILKTKKVDKIRKSLSFLPVVKADQIKKLSKKHVKNFDSNYNRIVKKIGKEATNKESSEIATCFATMYGIRDEIQSNGKDVSKLNKILKDRENFFTKYTEEVITGGVALSLAAFVIYILSEYWWLVLTGTISVTALIAITLLSKLIKAFE